MRTWTTLPTLTCSTVASLKSVMRARASSRSSWPLWDMSTCWSCLAILLGVLAQVPVLAGGGDRLGILGDLLRDDRLILLALALEALARDEQLLLLALGVRGDKRLDVREDLDEAGEKRLLGQLLEALVQEERVGEVARRLGIGR